MLILYLFIIFCILSLSLLLLIQFNNTIYIDQYLINLDHRQDRLKLTSKLLSDKGFTRIVRYPAVYGKKLSDEELKKIITPHAIDTIKNNYRKDHYELTYGAVGCSLSHINLWKNFINNSKNDIIMVFEDDTLPQFDINTFYNYFKYAPSDWDIILLGGLYNNPTEINKYFTKISSFYQTHAYVIHKKAIPKLLQRVFPLEKQLDSWLSDLAKENYINIYGITENKWDQNQEISATDIQNNII